VGLEVEADGHAEALAGDTVSRILQGAEQVFQEAGFLAAQPGHQLGFIGARDGRRLGVNLKALLEAYSGEGIQHIALGAHNIRATVGALRDDGMHFMDVPDSYYDMVDERLPGHGEELASLKDLRILIDGAPTEGQGLLLQIFAETVIGPIFFEIM